MIQRKAEEVKNMMEANKDIPKWKWFLCETYEWTEWSWVLGKKRTVGYLKAFQEESMEGLITATDPLKFLQDLDNGNE